MRQGGFYIEFEFWIISGFREIPGKFNTQLKSKLLILFYLQPPGPYG